jgi:hypothetical protein
MESGSAMGGGKDGLDDLDDLVSRQAREEAMVSVKAEISLSIC